MIGRLKIQRLQHAAFDHRLHHHFAVSQWQAKVGERDLAVRRSDKILAMHAAMTSSTRPFSTSHGRTWFSTMFSRACSKFIAILRVSRADRKKVKKDKRLASIRQ
jgi:hypothetical protein